MATLNKIRSKGVLLAVIVGTALLAFIIGDFLNSGSTLFHQSKQNVAEIAGEKALNNTFFTNHYSVDDHSEAGKAFVANYTKEFGQKPEALAVLGYDAVYVLADAIKRANSTDADKIIAALSDTKNFKAVSGITTINASHDADKSAVIIEMKDGKQILNTSIKP